MKRSKCRLSFISFLACLGVLAAIFLLPASGLALSTATSHGEAYIDWTQLSFSVTDVAGNPVPVSWIDPADGVTDTRSSFSSAWVGLNGLDTDPGEADSLEGAWVSTSFSATLADASGHSTGQGATGPNSVIIDPATQQPASVQTPADRISAMSDIALSSAGSRHGEVFIAQAALTGQFTVPSDTTLDPYILSVSVPFSLLQILSASNGGTATNEAQVMLTLLDFNTLTWLAGDWTTVASWLTGPGSMNWGVNDTLNLVYNNILPGIIYDFEAQASTTGSANVAPVPEPISLILVGSGLAGIATLRRRFKA